MQTLDLSTLQAALSGRYAAIRRVTRLAPIGVKVFPPTYEGGEYAYEERQVRDADGELRTVQTVLLDSVQSQANRLEQALLRAYMAGRIKMPLVQVDFAAAGDNEILQEVGVITTLDAPHRISDALFRDSLFDGVPFPESPLAKKIRASGAANATPLLEYCPTALLLGFWNSTDLKKGGMGAKLQRSLVSEIVGYAAVGGVRPASRIDRVIEKVPSDLDIFRGTNGQMTLDSGRAVKDDKGNPTPLKASKLLHGNITPSLRHDDDKKKLKGLLNHGGVTLDYAEQQTVLSLAALRRLRFPVETAPKRNADLAGQVLVAALGLAAICFQDEQGYDLRSRCLLDGASGKFEFVGRGEAEVFNLNEGGAARLLSDAASAAEREGLKWPTEAVTLIPSDDLAQLVVKSRQRTIIDED